MKDAFFVPSFGNKPKNLVGRNDVLQRFDECLDGVPGSKERALLILGQRGTGKTVLLLEMADKARNRGYIVSSPTVVSGEMPERIIEKLCIDGEKLIKKKVNRPTGGSLSLLGFGAGIQFGEEKDGEKSFSRKLSELCELFNKNGHPVLLLIDEAQAENEALKQLVISYQELVGEGRDIAIVMAGLPNTVSSILNDHVLTFLNRAVKIHLNPLKKNDIEDYYTAAFRELKINVTGQMVTEAAFKASGSPYMMQLIGHYVTIAASDEGKISNKSVQTAFSRAEEDFRNDICDTTLAAVSDRDLDVLKLIARAEKDCTVAELSKKLGVSNQYVQIYKKRLLQAGIIEQPGRGRVRIVVPYLKEYLQMEDEN